MRPCDIAGCRQPHSARGWCNAHYQLRKKYGDPLRERPNRPTLRERFESKVTKTDGCWLWPGGFDDKGYGLVRSGADAEGGDSMLKAHRVSWVLYRGPIPDGLRVLHRCDVRPCVNPDHLFLGTMLDNMRDCASKGRFAAQRKTHCVNGHPLSGANLSLSNGKRRCKECSRIGEQRYRTKQKGLT